eukprot:CAMPEP_0175900558 /NCGR_PEP_ID=MMETSP0108-20121206/2397_1 /TAXON_ID=195067 ORGANISM="Goniomonas pacifica, Strain CCMP1869" /NCGR_SAMPLE_ID=MMETSP0108 /ASSEMBLY_ACC=CAM_ASM_000204 /LENGTH=56 /DNA_ID=CAMNT_0017222091 /DNA_START=49 /DNA_END=220 /DNA_ORIENTATION=-
MSNSDNYGKTVPAPAAHLEVKAVSDFHTLRPATECARAESETAPGPFGRSGYGPIM